MTIALVYSVAIFIGKFNIYWQLLHPTFFWLGINASGLHGSGQKFLGCSGLIGEGPTENETDDDNCSISPLANVAV